MSLSQRKDQKSMHPLPYSLGTKSFGKCSLTMSRLLTTAPSEKFVLSGLANPCPSPFILSNLIFLLLEHFWMNY